MRVLTAFLCLTFAVLLFSAGEVFALPPCPKDQNQRFHDCFGTRIFSNGDKYVGEFREDVRHGQGTYTFSNGEKYVGAFKNNARHGQGTYTFSNGDKYAGVFKNNKGFETRKEGAYTFAKRSTKWRDKLLGASLVLCEKSYPQDYDTRLSIYKWDHKSPVLESIGTYLNMDICANKSYSSKIYYSNSYGFVLCRGERECMKFGGGGGLFGNFFPNRIKYCKKSSLTFTVYKVTAFGPISCEGTDQEISLTEYFKLSDPSGPKIYCRKTNGKIYATSSRSRLCSSRSDIEITKAEYDRQKRQED